MQSCLSRSPLALPDESSDNYQMRRMQFIRLLRDFVIPDLFEEYWKVVFDSRNQNDEVTEISPFMDIFKPSMIEIEGEKKVVWLCAVPKTRHFWDIILAAYSLFWPRVFYSFRKVASSIINILVQEKVSLSGYINFGEDIFGYLQGIAFARKGLEGGNGNWFLQDPESTVCNIKRMIALTQTELDPLAEDKDITLIRTKILATGKKTHTDEKGEIIGEESPTIQVPLVEDLQRMERETRETIQKFFQ